MCGIAGHFGRLTAPAVRERMMQAIATRGPDAQHVLAFDDRGTIAPATDLAPHALVHARLSIIDPRPEADQPMGVDDLYVCYNGEVYDWEADAHALAAKGARFRTRCDTEYLLHGFRAYGIDGLLERLTGMFAFALVDFRARVVHLVRDRLGKKPLVYAHVGRGLAFGSTVRSVMPWLDASQRTFSPESIDAFLAHRYVPAPRTILARVQRVPNGHRLQYDLDTGEASIVRYWAPVPRPAADMGAVLDTAVHRRTVADRPLGLFLSGGADSATVASRLAATGHRGLHSFSAAFPGTEFDESEDAAQTASALGLPNERIVVPTAVGADFDRIVASLDEPFADPSAFPTWYLARETVKRVTVVLGGDGGDELFGGYKRIAHHLRSAWRNGWRLPLPTLPSARAKGWRKVATELGVSWEDAYALRFSGLTPGQRAFLQPALAAPPVHRWRVPDARGPTRVERLLAWDFANYLPEYILRKADLCTMAHGLELRAPLLDHHLVEAVLALPPALRFTDPPKRYLATLAPDLDRLGVFARKKRGFNPPVNTWLRGDLASRLPGLGERLARVTSGQLDAHRTARFVATYGDAPGLAEQVLSLIVLDTSLQQLADLSRHG